MLLSSAGGRVMLRRMLPASPAFRHLAFARNIAARWCGRRGAPAKAERVLLRPLAPPALATVIHAPAYAVTTRISNHLSLKVVAAFPVRVQRLPVSMPMPSMAPAAGSTSPPVPTTARLVSARVPAPLADGKRREPVHRSEMVVRAIFRPRSGEAAAWSGAGLLSSVVPRIERTRVRRVETVVRQTRIETVPGNAGGVPSAAAHALRPQQTSRPTAGALAPAPGTAYSDSEVKRLTDRVVADINRRIIAQRERLGRI